MTKKVSIAMVLTLMLSLTDWGIHRHQSVALPTETISTATNKSSQENRENSGVGRIVEAKGRMQIKRRGESHYRTAGLGAVLYPGDLVWPTSGARVRVRCADGSIWTVPSGEPSGASNYCSLPEADREPIITPRGFILPARATGYDEFYIISPRSTGSDITALLLNDRPRLRWSAVPRATLYIVKITGKEMDWETQVSGTDILYSGEKPLESGVDYTMTVQVDNGQAVSEMTFRLLDENEQESIREKVAGITQQNLPQEAEALVLADFYYENELIDEAIELLESQVAEGNQSAAIYYTLANLYRWVDLPSIAENYFIRAVELAVATNDTAMQVEIQTELFNLVSSYIKMANYTAADNLLQKTQTLSRDNKFKYDWFTYLGLLRLKESRYAWAKVNLQKAIDLNSEPGRAYCYMAELLEEQGNQLSAQAATLKCQR